MRYPCKGIVTFGLVGLILIVGTTQHVMGAGNVDAGGKIYQTRCSPCHGSAMMPPQTDLTDQQLEDLIAFVRTLAIPPYNGK